MVIHRDVPCVCQSDQGWVATLNPGIPCTFDVTAFSNLEALVSSTVCGGALRVLRVRIFPIQLVR
jgi:hypothetical protein